MRRNVLTTELLLPLVLVAIVLIPFSVLMKLLDWSNHTLTLAGFLVLLILVFVAEPLETWLAPRLGLPPPRRLGKRHRAD
jgi:hypothetical protein